MFLDYEPGDFVINPNKPQSYDLHDRIVVSNCPPLSLDPERFDNLSCLPRRRSIKLTFQSFMIFAVLLPESFRGRLLLRRYKSLSRKYLESIDSFYIFKHI